MTSHGGAASSSPPSSAESSNNWTGASTLLDPTYGRSLFYILCNKVQLENISIHFVTKSPLAKRSTGFSNPIAPRLAFLQRPPSHPLSSCVRSSHSERRLAVVFRRGSHTRRVQPPSSHFRRASDDDGCGRDSIPLRRGWPEPESSEGHRWGHHRGSSSPRRRDGPRGPRSRPERTQSPSRHRRFSFKPPRFYRVSRAAPASMDPPPTVPPDVLSSRPERTSNGSSRPVFPDLSTKLTSVC